MVAPSDTQLDASDTRMPAQSSFDCIMQIQSSPLAHRMVLYHKDPEVRYRLYPAGGGEEFSELEKVPEIHPTDELVLLRNLSVTPLEFKRWLDSSFFKHSITRAFFLNNQMATSKEVSKKTKRKTFTVFTTAFI